MTLLQIVLALALLLVGLGMVFAVYMLLRMYAYIRREETEKALLLKRLSELEVSK